MHLEPEINFSTVLLFLGVIQGLFLAFIILNSPGKIQRGHKFLGLFLLLFSLMSVEDFLFESRYILRCPYMINTLTLLIFTLAPTLYFYARAMTSEDFRFDWRESLHYLPFAVIVLLSLPEIFQPAAVKLREVEDYYSRGDYYFNLSILLPMLQITAYFAVIVRLLLRHVRRIKNSFSFTEGISLRWITTLIVLNLFFWLIWIAVYFSRWSSGLKILNIAYTLLIYTIGYFGIRQKDIFSSQARPVQSVTTETPPQAGNVKYAKSGLTAETRKTISNRLIELMEEQKPYLNPDLTLPGLAKLLDVSVNHLSQIINTELNDNFYNFVNGYRLNEVKKLMANPLKKNYTILALAFESGFQSKSAFNSFFKKIVGCSPKDFLSSLSKQETSPQP